MLVLTRKQRQRIVIGGEIELVVLDIRDNRVKLGVTAPPEVSIRREELEPARENPVALLRRDSLGQGNSLNCI